MIGNRKDELRRLVPRWRPLLDTAGTGELSQDVTPIGRRPRLSHPPTLVKHAADKLEEEFERARLGWLKERSVTTASELLSIGIVLGEDSRVIEAANFIVAHQGSTTPTNLAIAKQIKDASLYDQYDARSVQPNTQKETINEINSNMALRLRLEIRDYRQRLILDCNNPVVWAEMALSYSNLGQNIQAEKSMRCALFLAPTNRYILRCMTRLLIHLSRPDEAQHLLVANLGTAFDPWLMASEIAASSILGRKSKLIKQGNDVLDRGQLRPRQLTELAGALATVALEHGDTKRAKGLFRQSLLDPTENVAAQVGWVSAHHHIMSNEAKPLNLAFSNEAQVHLATSEGRWLDAAQQTMAWLAVEPFAPRAATHGSWLATALLNDPKLGEAFARAGLLANPNDKMLLNNLAVALAQQNKVDGARAIFSDIGEDMTGMEDTFTATDGLINFRSGSIERGRELYFRAIDVARDLGQKVQVARVFVYYLHEELRVSPKRVTELLPQVEAFCKDLKNVEVGTKLKELHSALEASAQIQLL